MHINALTRKNQIANHKLQIISNIPEAIWMNQGDELIKKAEEELYEPPKSGAETYMKIMQERGKL